MNTSYLLSVLDLYLAKEKDGNAVIEIENINNLVKVSCSFTFDHNNRTFVKVDKNEFMGRVGEIVQKLQGNLEVNKENLLNYNEQRSYIIDLSSGRKLTFINFDDNDLNIIRNNFANMPARILQKEPVNVPALDDLVIDIDDDTEESYNQILEKNTNKKPAFSFGFTSFMSLFLISIWILDIFMIALWIFKAFTK